jgi:hypothetical protein
MYWFRTVIITAEILTRQCDHHIRAPYRQDHGFTDDCAEDHPERENGWLHG